MEVEEKNNYHYMWHNLPLSFPFHSALFHLSYYIQLWIDASTLGIYSTGTAKVEYAISDNLTILLLGIFTQKKWMHVSTTGLVLNVHRSNMSRRNVLEAKNWELLKGSSITEWKNKCWYIHTVEHYNCLQ